CRLLDSKECYIMPSSDSDLDQDYQEECSGNSLQQKLCTPSLSKRKTPELKCGERGFLVVIEKSVDKSAKLNEMLNLFEKFYIDESSEQASCSPSINRSSRTSTTSLSIISELTRILTSSSDKLSISPDDDMDKESDDSSTTIGDGKHNAETSTHSQSTITDVCSPRPEKEIITDKNNNEDPGSPGCSKNVEIVDQEIQVESEKPRAVETIPMTDSSSDSSTSIRLQLCCNHKIGSPSTIKSKSTNSSRPKTKSKAPTESTKHSKKDTKENSLNLLSSHTTSINIKNLQEILDPATKRIYFENPYKVEIDRWIPKSKSSFMRLTDKYQLRQLHETPYNIIHTEGRFDILIKDLKSVTEFGFSTLHSNRSYYGFTCVIAISTRYKDYIVDCFGLRDLLQKLNIYFTHPGVLKVAHNCRTDIEYLQKDFGIYVVGLYDSSEAEKVIQCSKTRKSISLDQLLEEYLTLKFNTRFKKADWRIRPLPKSMTDYARSRSHYLLKLYDMQKEKLLSVNCRDILYQVYENSKDICRVHYVQPDRVSWVLKYKSVFSNQQLYALRAMNEWRNKVASEEDEAPHWIASNKALLTLSTVLPSKFREIVYLSKKNFVVTSFMEQDKHKLLDFLAEAKDLPLVTPQIQVLKRRVVECCLSTKVPTLVFLKAKHDHHSKVVYKIMEHFQAEGNFACPNYIQRILPVDVTCKNDLNHICKTVEALVDSGCKNENETYEISSNFRFDKQYTLIAAIRKSVKKKKPRWNYAEDGSNFCIIIYAIRKLRRCCVSFVDCYRKFNQFYLRSS
ncbi:unnamed protein product, partial [Allacma fusca]